MNKTNIPIRGLSTSECGLRSPQHPESLTNRVSERGLCAKNIRFSAISDDYTVLVNSNFAEDVNSVFALSQFVGNPIKLPYNESFYPNKDCLAAHRARHGFQ